MASLATTHTLGLAHTNICPINDVLGCVTEQTILNITNKKRTKCPEISICRLLNISARANRLVDEENETGPLDPLVRATGDGASWFVIHTYLPC